MRLLACLAILSCAFSIGCGGSDQLGPPGSTSGGGTTTGSSTDGGTPTPRPPYSYAVTISGFGSSPEELVVPAGATVTITNDDSTPHSLMSQGHLQIQ